MAILFKNNAASTLSSIYISSTGKFSDLYVADSSVFPSITAGTGDYFYLTLVGDDTLEIVKAFETGTNSSGGKYIRVYRAQEDTVQQDWPAGTRVEMRITADALNSFVPTAVQIAKDNVDAIGVASTTNVGFAGVDGETTQANAEGVVTAKDVAIGGDASDLASARGQIGDARLVRIADFNEFTKAGIYRAGWGGENAGINGPATGIVNGIVHVDTYTTTSGSSECRQTIFRLGTPGSNDWHIHTRESMDNGRTWSPWRWILTDASLGDGLRFSGGIISVPEYEGATASANGVSGLVPPPLKADLGKSLGANGEWTYPADVAVGGDVNDLASMRGQIGQARELGDNVDYNTVVEAGFYLINANGSVNAPFAGNAFFLQVFRSKKDTLNKNFYQIAYNYSSARERTFIRQYRTASKDWSPWSEILMSSNIGDGITVNNGIISVPEYEGATASSAGTSGLVPPAAAGEENFVLHGDGTYRPVTPSYEVLNNFRKSMIGMSFPFPSTTLPEGFVWADGSLILFEDYPEVKEKYEAGGFDGMLLAWDADEKTIAAKLGKWRPNAATPTGLFVPNWGGQFSRAWVPDDVTDAGSSAPDTGRGLTGSWITGWEDGYVPTIQTTGAFYLKSFSAAQRQGTTIITVTQPFQVLFDASRVWGEEHTGQAFAPAHIQQPYAIYLGVPA